MKRRLSAYWWCQIIGWGAFILMATYFYFYIPGFTGFETYSSLFSTGILGLLTSHLMRLFIIKAKLLKQKIWKQVISMLLTTLLFSFIYLVFQWLVEFLRIQGKFKLEYNFLDLLFVGIFLNTQFLGIWNLIYFSYHYIKQNRNQLIEKVRLESELKIQRLEIEKTKIEMQQQATELQIKAMVATQEQERKRISRDLHDDVGTNLSALNLFLYSLEEKAKCIDNTEIRALAQSSRQFIKEAMHDVRQLLLNLSPTVLEEFGYITAVEGLVNKINETKQIHFNLLIVGINHRLQKDYELALYRITQELINNVLKHARAKNVSLQVVQRDEKIILVIEDDGKGFDVNAHKDGYGLNNLDARTKLMKGVMTIDSQPGKGTAVHIEIPHNFK